MTTTGRQPEQPQRPQTPTDSRPVADRSAAPVARIQGLSANGFLVDELPETIYAVTAHGATGEAHRIALARLVNPPVELTAIWPNMIETTVNASEALERFLDSCVQAGLKDAAETDAKARALWLRQHRNTGPTQRQRAPRHLDTTRRRTR